MQSEATTVKKYLATLPADRRKAIAALRKVILANLDQDYEEGMQYGMIGYYVPHRVYPEGYHCNPAQPLPFAGLASQKHHMSLYLMSACGAGAHGEWFSKAWAKTGKKLDMGKCCVRFKQLDDLALDVIAEALRRMPARKYIEHYEAAIHTAKKRPTTIARKPKPAATTKKAVRKTTNKKSPKAAKKAGRALS